MSVILKLLATSLFMIIVFVAVLPASMQADEPTQADHSADPEELIQELNTFRKRCRHRLK